MSSRDWPGALFAMSVVTTVTWAIVFASGCAAGEPDEEEFLLAVFGATICRLLWELWHEKAIEPHIEICKLPDGREIRKEHWE